MKTIGYVDFSTRMNANMRLPFLAITTSELKRFGQPPKRQHRDLKK